MTVDLSDFKKLYFQTAFEYVQNIEVELNALPLNAQPTAFKSLHRYAHSLKSQSAVMKYGEIAEAAGLFEQIFDELLKGEKQLSRELLNILQTTIKTVHHSLEILQSEKDDMTILNEEIINLKKFV